MGTNRSAAARPRPDASRPRQIGFFMPALAAPRPAPDDAPTGHDATVGDTGTSPGRPGRAVATLANPMQTPLRDAIEIAVTEMRTDAARRLYSRSTVDKYEATLKRFADFAEAPGNGVTTLGGATEALARAFVNAPLHTGPGRSTRLTGNRPASGTLAQRRAALGAMFEVLRQHGLTDWDPTARIPVGAQARKGVKPATPAQVRQICASAARDVIDTRRAAAVALMIAGAWVGEVPYVRVADLDAAGRQVRLPGSVTRTRIQPRTVTLGQWEAQVLAQRVSFLRAHLAENGTKSADIDDWPIAFPRPASQYPSASVSPTASELVMSAMDRAGVDRAATGLTPMSLTQFAVNCVYALTRSAEAVAELFGVRSLDRARGVICDHWQAEFAEPIRQAGLNSCSHVAPLPFTSADAA